MTIRWTKAQRKKLSGNRQVHKANAPEVGPSLEWAWNTLRNRHQGFLDEGCTYDAAGKFQPLLQKVLEDAQRPTPPEVLDVPTEFMRMGTHMLEGFLESYLERQIPLKALLSLWLHQSDWHLVQKLIEGAAAFGNHGMYRRVGDTRTSHLNFIATPRTDTTPPPVGFGDPYLLTGLWENLRAQLFASPKYEQERQAASAWRAQLQANNDIVRLHQLAFAFSKDAQWAHEEATALLAVREKRKKAPIGKPQYLLAAITDADLALKVAETFSAYLGHRVGNLSFDIVESIGTKAIPILELLLEDPAWTGKREKKPIAMALKLARK